MYHAILLLLLCNNTDGIDICKLCIVPSQNLMLLTAKGLTTTFVDRTAIKWSWVNLCIIATDCIILSNYTL